MEPQPARTRLICSLTGTTVEAMLDQMRQAVAAGCDCLECRLDYLAARPSLSDVATIINACECDVIATCRPVREGGKFVGDESERLAILQAASDAGAAFIDVESDVPTADTPSGTIISSHHDFETCPDDLDQQAEKLDASPAAVNKIAFNTTNPADTLRAFDVVRG
ncbi:MAG: type I 3-dehydroquinate dehydratase, partial [bacterium]|nr:type I 3-dehydroquinate dehydratase [bacterium]